MKTKEIIKLISSIGELFKLAIELEKKQIEKLALTPKTIPDYSKGSVKDGGLMMVNDGSGPNHKETIINHDGKKVTFIDPLHLLKIENNKLKLKNEELEAKIKNILCGSVDNRKIEDIVFPLACSTPKNNFKDAIEYRCYSEMSKFINDKLKKIDKSIGHSTAGGGNYPRTNISEAFKLQEDWNKQLNNFLKEKGLNNTQPFGFVPIDDKTIFDRYSDKFFIIDEKGNKTEINKPFDFNITGECPHENIDVERYYNNYSDRIGFTVSTCSDCGLNLTLDRIQKQKQRQLEIGKEIEKLRNEARTIKNQLKDSN